MPYTMDTLPDAVKRLPQHAQEIWLAAYNAAWRQYGGDEEKAFATAWAAVRRKYRQTDDGEWVQMTTQIPEWIRVLPLGQVNLADDREPFWVDQEGLEAVMAAWQRRGNDLVVDYEHQTMTGSEAPAAGWIKELDVRDDGLWARVEWTEKAADYISRREYRYFSPVVKLDSQRRVRELLNVALTNFPAITNLLPLAAKHDWGVCGVEIMAEEKSDRDRAREAQEARSRKYGIGIKEGGHITKPTEWADVPDDQWGDPVNYRYPMPDYKQARAAWAYWNKPKNQQQYTPEERRKITERIRRRAEALGVTISEREETKMEVLKLLGLPEDADTDQVRRHLEALRHQAEQVETALQEVAALKAELRRREAQELIDEALRTGRTTPGELDRADGRLRRLAVEDPQLFRDLVMSRPEGLMVPLRTLADQEKQAQSQQEDAETLRWCRMFGITVEQYRASQAQIEARRNQREV